jgi:predicted transcriptional regulator
MPAKVKRNLKLTAQWATAQEIMVTKLHVARPEQRVLDVVNMLLKNRISGAPVVDENRMLVGIISEKDCIKALMRAVHHGVPFSQVSDVMSTKIITISEDTHIMAMSHLFLSHPIRRLPVLRDGKLVGQVSRRDVLKRAVSLFDGVPTRNSAVLYLSALGAKPPV